MSEKSDKINQDMINLINELGMKSMVLDGIAAGMAGKYTDKEELEKNTEEFQSLTVELLAIADEGILPEEKNQTIYKYLDVIMKREGLLTQDTYSQAFDACYQILRKLNLLNFDGVK